MAFAVLLDRRFAAAILAGFHLLGGPSISGLSAAEAPKPRVRLVREASVAVARREDEPSRPVEPVALEKVVVAESKLPAPPRPLSEKVRESFSLVDGGPVFTRKWGGAEISIGLWRHAEIFEEEARFKPPRMHAEFDLLRIKW